MKNLQRQKHTNSSAGFSTLELLIAFAVITLSLTAVIMVAFGNQSVTLDTELAQRALYFAEQELEEAGADALQNGFEDLVDIATTSGKYTATTTFSDDYCFKIIETEVGWKRNLRDLTTILTTIISSPEESESSGGDCPAGPLGDEWDNPTSLDIEDIIASGDSGTDLDVIEHTEGVFAFLSSAQAANKGDLWVINITDIDNIDSDSVESVYSDSANYNAIDSYVDSSTDIVYSFLASASSTAELQVLRTTFPPAYPSQPPLIELVQSFDLPDDATDVKYQGGKVFVSTLGSNSNEFFTYDETSPGFLAPDQVADVGNNVDVFGFDIAGNWAYLATADNSRELIAFQFESPASKVYFNAPGNADGFSVYSSDQYTYLGRKRDASADDFFILRNSDIQDGDSSTDGIVGSVDLDDDLCTRQLNEENITTSSCLSPGSGPEGTKIVGIAVLGDFAFLSTDDSNAEFQIWDVSNKTNPKPHIGCNTYEFPAKPSAIEFPGKIVYDGYPQGRELGFLAVNSNDALRVIYDPAGPTICLPE